MHTHWLGKEVNYPKGNHGIMADLAMIQATANFPFLDQENSLQMLALERLEKHLAYDFSPSGVHLENSPAYHMIVTQLYKKLFRFCDEYDIKLKPVFANHYARMLDYLAIVSLPSGGFPLIGDTKKEGSIKSFLTENSLIDYLLTNGRVGMAPPPGFHDTFSGVFIARGYEPCLDYKNTSYLFLQGGMQNRLHKHADNLSFVFSSLGKEVIVDGGHYSYTNSPWTKYFLSTMAHNNIVINENTYHRNQLDNGDIITDSVRFGERISYFKGYHTGYEGFRVSRKLLFIHPNLILVKDDVLPENPDKISRIEQVFNFGKGFEPKDISFDQVWITDDTIDIKIEQHLPFDTITHYHGNESPIRGWRSELTLKKDPVHQVSFVRSGMGPKSFVCSILLQSDGYCDPVKSFEFSEALTSIKVQRQNTFDTLEF
jgi:hypothetical protein